MNILLSGSPGIGKTTVIEKIARALGDRAGGMLTAEIREKGRRTGFAIESLDGSRRLLATREKVPGPRVGPYTVILANLEEVGADAIRRAIDTGKTIIIDEIGKMEIASPLMRRMILESLASRMPTVATVSVAADPFLEAVRRRRDVRMVEVTIRNRDSLPDEILRRLENSR